LINFRCYAASHRLCRRWWKGLLDKEVRVAVLCRLYLKTMILKNARLALKFLLYLVG
jgi:hypothetical protein